MKTKLICFLVAGVSACLIAVSPGMSQTLPTPGFSLGGFFDYRVENEINSDDLSFMNFGGRIGFRSERWVEFFIDVGAEKMSFEPLEDKTAFCAGLGGIFWLMRQEYGYGPFDLGLFGSAHFSDYSGVKIKGTDEKTDIKHYRYVGQMVIRAQVQEGFKVFLRGGVLGTNLDPDSGLDDDDLDKIQPAVNTGVELELVNNLIATLELNYYESVGGAIHLDFWF